MSEMSATTPIQNPHVFKISEGNFEMFKTRFAKLARRADKLHCGQIGYREIGEEFKDVVKEDPSGCHALDKRYKVRIVIIEVFGDSPKLSGWTFIAKLEHDDQLGTAVKTMPGMECPEQYRTVSRHDCDHCHKNLFRKDTFVVRNEAGEYKHVGRQCLRDFLGHENPDDVARYAECFYLAFEMGGDAEEWGFGGGRYEQYFDLEHVLAITSKAIQSYGWLSKTKAYEEGLGWPTAERVASYIFETSTKIRDEKLTPDEESKAEALIAIKWAEELTDEELKDNDYLYNINLLAKAGMTNSKRFGFACSILMSYRRAMDKLVKRSQAAESIYFGEVGKRMPIGQITLDSVRGPFEGQFGPTYVYRFKIDTNRILVWFTGTKLESKSGDIVTMKAATIKEHKEWKGWKETIINRPTFDKGRIT